MSSAPPAPPPQQQQQQQPPPQQQQPPPPQPGRGPRGNSGGRTGPVSIAPTSGVPYGHVPSYLPGSSSLIEELDQRLLMVLRDGRHLVGTLRSFDQYSNMVLEDTKERKTHRHSDGATYYADIDVGLQVVRGESIVLLGQTNESVNMKSVPLEELNDMIDGSEADELEWDFDKDLLA